MEIKEVRPNVFFVDAPGAGVNVYFLRTSKGIVLIDTTSSVEEMRAVMDLAGFRPADVHLLITTHADGDHVGGNSLFTGTSLAHQSVLARMGAFDRALNELPNETFDDPIKTITVGEFEIELIYTGGHKPDQTILWLPKQKVLIPSDLLFQGSYPFMVGCQLERWIEALESLHEYPAEVILPGHGTLSTWEDIDRLAQYFRDGINAARELKAMGLTMEDAGQDPAFPRVDGWEREGRIEANNGVFLQQTV
jgi:cyclase